MTTQKDPRSVKTTLSITPLGLGIFDLSAASVIEFSTSIYNVTEDVNAQVEVVGQRTNDLDTVVSEDFATTTNGTATPGAD
jgi:hypothetical protein